MSSIPLVPTPEVWQHILFGDERGGGHLFGTGVEHKTEFPDGWHLSRIEKALETLQMNYIARFGPLRTGKIEGFVDGIVLRLAIHQNDIEPMRIVSFYPLRGSGVYEIVNGVGEPRPLLESEKDF